MDDPIAITNSFNDFFVNVGPETEKSVPKVPNMSPSKFLKNRNQIDFIIAHTSENELLEITYQSKVLALQVYPLNF